MSRVCRFENAVLAPYHQLKIQDIGFTAIIGQNPTSKFRTSLYTPINVH